MFDFYRLPGGEALGRQLSSIDRHKDHIITSSQVEMEFKRNRQSVLLSLRKSFNQEPKLESFPPILQNAKAGSALKTAHEKHRQQYKKVQARIEKLLGSPKSDAVFVGLNKLFKHDSPLNLHKDHKDRNEIRSLARKRWELGYPPRKKNDTSFGDAINWEWVVQCAVENPGNDVVIVSRDHDFGEEFGGTSYLNDWLAQEFKERVGRNGGGISLTARLTEGFKRIGLKVPKEAVKEEKKLLEERAEKIRHYLEAAAISSASTSAETTYKPRLSVEPYRSVPIQSLLSSGFYDDED